jgi:hypothetical protein
VRHLVRPRAFTALELMTAAVCLLLVKDGQPLLLGQRDGRVCL